jgi:hypothetical protein
MPNRLTALTPQVSAKLKGLTTTKCKSLRDTLKLDMDEVFAWQTAKSRAQIEGVISVDEALTIYHAIQHWSTTSLALQIVITEMMRVILAGQIAARQTGTANV